MLQRNSEVYPALPLGGRAARAASNPDAGEGIDFREMLRILRRRAWIIGVSVATLLFLAVLVVLFAAPLYTATSTILIDPRRQNVVQENQAVLTSFGTDDAAIESQVLLIQSGTVSYRVLGTLDLIHDPEFGPDQGDLGNIKAEPGKSAEDIARSLTVDALQRRTKVTRQGTTFLVDVNVTSKDAAKAASISNAIAEAYLTEQIRTKYDATKLAAGWLDTQIQDLKARVSASERAVADFRTANNLVVSQGITVNEQQISDLNNRLIEARAETAGAIAKFQQVQDIAKKKQDLGAIAEVLSSDVIARLRNQYADIAKSGAELLSKYGPRHPSVANVQAQLRDTQRLIDEEVQRIVSSKRHAYEVAKSREDSLQKSLDDVRGISSESSQAQVRLRELQREAEANRSLYESYLARYKETNAQESLESSDSRIAARATVPLAPSFPKKRMLLALAVLVGLGTGCVLAFFVDYLDDRVKSARQLESLSGFETVATIPLIGTRELARRAQRGREELPHVTPGFTGLFPPRLQPPLMRYAIEEPTSLFAEAIRSIRLSLQRTIADAPAHVIMVASSSPNEGKTTTASNLALSFARIGVRTVLVDGDLRNPQLTLAVSPHAKLGLFDVAVGRAPLERALLVDDTTGLAVLPSPRTHAVNLAEFVGANGMRAILDQLRARFSVIIVDAPPVVAMVDGRAIAEHADHIVFAVAWNRTSTEAVREGLDGLAPVHDRIIGTVLTQVDLNRLRHFDYYRSAAHLSGYSYYRNSVREAAE